jgi:phage baseplate assembly protein W
MSARQYGLTFPIVLENGSYKLPTEEESITSSISTILSWNLGRRSFNVPFGSILEPYLLMPNSPKQQGFIKFYVMQALAKWEPRLRVTDVNFNVTVDTVTLEIQGYLKNSKTSYNYLATL